MNESKALQRHRLKLIAYHNLLGYVEIMRGTKRGYFYWSTSKEITLSKEQVVADLSKLIEKEKKAIQKEVETYVMPPVDRV